MSSPPPPPSNPNPDFIGAGLPPPPPPLPNPNDVQPIGDLKPAEDRHKTMTEKFRAQQRDKFSQEYGVAPQGQDRYGNPTLYSQQQVTQQTQQYYHDQYGRLVPIVQQSNPDGPGSGLTSSSHPGTQYQQQQQQFPGIPPQAYQYDPFGPAPYGSIIQQQQQRQQMTPSQCFFGPILPALMSAGMVCTMERFFKKPPGHPPLPFDTRKFGMYTGGAILFFWIKCPLKVTRGYNTPLDSFIAGGTVGSLGVNNGLLSTPFFGQKEIAAAMMRYKWLRPAHIGFLSWGGICMMIDTIFGLP